MVEALRIALREGRLDPGSQMPSSRDLAVQWGISRGLVSAAYEELQTEGFLVSRPGSGTYVAAGANGGPSSRGRDTPDRRDLEDAALSPARIASERPFIARDTDVSLFPLKTWKRLTSEVLSAADDRFFRDPDPAGLRGLREQVARYLGFARGFRCEPDDILITTGIRHGLDLSLRCLTRTGDTVWTEAPGYGGAEALLRLQGLIAAPIPVDRQGMRVEVGEAVAPAAKLCLVTPSHQSPLGVRLSFERRQSLLAWAERRDAYIFEDDYDGEFAFDTVRFPALKAMDEPDRVIHAGSFNKVLFPTLRIGYLVLPRALKARARRLREETGRNNSATDQHVLSRFLSGGHFAHHVRRVSPIYQDKCRAAVRAIATAYGQPLDIVGDHCGFHFFLILPDGSSAHRLLDRAQAHGLVLQSADIHDGPERKPGLIIGYSSLSLPGIDVYGAALGTLMKTL